ncbi:DUF6470 family protein [Paenibacillus sp. SC116]|uniref:DUF6470 family protein n=1 Tax=Paenibacillus sp. SC116 TaxID=2968986 RepID=UPI00215B3980|nr:DUF6470 family protein [Paenibacillus sp. SC116]MCR8844801.1 DUF6470 family protein [Paenibacillus sp. SC116]
MNLPRIEINQQFARVGLERNPGQLKIETPPSELKIHQEHVSVELSRSDDSLSIDSRKAWSALGRARFEEVTDRIAQQSLQISMQNIANLAQEGDRMMASHQKSNAFAEIARERMFRQFRIDIAGEPNYDNVEVTYMPGQLQTNVKPGGVNFEFERTKPSIDYYPGKINPYLIQQNFIFFNATGQQLDAVM